MSPRNLILTHLEELKIDFLQVSTHNGYIVTTNLVQIIKNKIQHSEFDYIALTGALSGYANPRNQISKLIRNGDIVRVKKGIYVFGPTVGAAPFSHAILAHWIYGPSYLSCETALAYYGLIPERVEATISMTPKRDVQFDTPVGRFVYHPIKTSQYTLGMTQVELYPNRYVLMATPEKALVDMINKLPPLPTLASVQSWLHDSLRIEPESIIKLSKTRFITIAQAYSKQSNVALLQRYREDLK